jgi:hypothetical protein
MPVDFNPAYHHMVFKTIPYCSLAIGSLSLLGKLCGFAEL